MKNWFKKILAGICTVALALSAVSTVILAAPGTLSIASDEGKKVLKPGCVDEYTDDGKSDYATAFGTAGTMRGGWAMEATDFWGITGFTTLHSLWDYTGTSGQHNDDSGVWYKVVPDSYVSVPVYARNIFNGIQNAVELWYSTNGTTYTKFEDAAVKGRETDSNNPLFQLTANGYIWYLTVQMPEQAGYLKVKVPSKDEFSSLLTTAGIGPDWLDSGAFGIGMVKASSTPITAYTGEGAGDPVVDYYEDASIIAKPREAYSSNCGYKNRVVTLENGRALVRAENDAAVTLQNVLDGLTLTNTAVSFWNGEQEITNLTTVAKNGMIMKAANTSKGNEVYAEYTIWVYSYETPSIKNDQTKRVLKPGVIDTLADNGEGYWCSDYARVLGSLHTVDGSAPSFYGEQLGWVFDNNNYPKSNVQWGYAHEAFYTRWAENVLEHDETWDGLEYRVVPESYVAVPVRIHNGLLGDTISIEGAEVYKPTFTVSADGANWEAAPETAESYNAFMVSGVNDQVI